tara:strand:- start:1056 stop:1280 length:225 start_codon:yes stop_codon:yes gene_type:complete
MKSGAAVPYASICHWALACELSLECDSKANEFKSNNIKKYLISSLKKFKFDLKINNKINQENKGLITFLSLFIV